MGHQFEEISSRVIGAAIDVHKELGPGFIEWVYDRAIRIAMDQHGITYESQKEIDIHFGGHRIGCHRLDLVVDKQIIVELKAIKGLEDIHFAQLRSYLKASGLHVGLLMNFNAPTLVVRRVVM